MPTRCPKRLNISKNSAYNLYVSNINKICSDDMHTLINEILHQILYKKYELLINYNEKYKFELHTLNRSVKKYIDAA